MTDAVRKRLVDLVAAYGKSLAGDPKRTEGLLRDTCPGCGREIFLLVSAQRLRVPEDLATLSSSVPREALFRRLTRRFHDELGIDEALGVWAVHSWAIALGLLSPEAARAGRRSRKETAGKGTGGTPSTSPSPLPSLVVSAAGDGHFRTVADAIREARPGTRIFLRPGQYREEVTVDRALEVIGEGPATSVILEAAGPTGITVKGGALYLHGVTLREGSSAAGSVALLVKKGLAIVEDSVVAGGETSVLVQGSGSSAVLRRCTMGWGAARGVAFLDRARGSVDECRIPQPPKGIVIAGGADPVIRSTRLEDCQTGIGVSARGKGTIEGCTITASRHAAISVADLSDPQVTRCRIQNGNFGIEVIDRGRGRVTETEIEGMAAGVFISGGGNPVLTGCTIRDGRFGVSVAGKGRGLLEDCRITGNQYSGVTVKEKGNPVLRRCIVTGNRDVGLWAYRNGAATVEQCDLTGNGKGPFSLEAGSRVKRDGNREN
ncbi:MAG: right-handed parallel beta-helix repeat-containing protein [Methanomicrobiales archaeon]|nr:right-handed parallel beta-helix repeat-containing protein [Methanomicrobiales archaeon]